MEKKIQKYICDQENLIALNAENGELVKKFGKRKKKLKKYCQITPVIIDEKIIIATFEPSIETYDLNSENYYGDFI